MTQQTTMIGDALVVGDLAATALRVRRRLQDTVTLAASAHRRDLAARCELELRRLDLPTPATVVVAGETKRGKSSLLNALLDRPGLLPTDTDVATGVHVVVRYAETPTALVFRHGSELGDPVGLDTLPDWVAEAGNPGNHKRVAYADVGLPLDGLRELRYIDTPGVHGLTSAHGDATLAALAVADALLFVLDTTAPISGPEMSFLRQAAERIDTVLVVLTKTDLQPQWRDIWREDTELLATAADRFAGIEVLPVSSKLATRAGQRLASGAAGAAELLDRSGLPKLQHRLRHEVAARRSRLRCANTVRVARAALDAIRGTYDDALAAHASEDAPEAELAANAQRQRDVETSMQAWKPSLYEALGSVERRAVNQLQDQLTDIRNQFEIDIAQRWRAGRLDTLPAEIDSDLFRCGRTAVAALANDIAEAVGTVAVAHDVAGFELAVLEAPLPVRERGQARPVPAVDAATTVRVGQQLLHSSTSLSGLLSGAAAGANPIGWILGLLGLLSAGLGLAGTRRVAEQAEARRLLSETIARWQRDLAAAMSDAVRAARHTADDAIGGALTDRRAVLRQQAQQLAQLQAEATRSAQTRSALQRGRAACLAGIDDCDQLLARLATA
jgi:hypothetical protein